MNDQDEGLDRGHGSSWVGRPQPDRAPIYRQDGSDACSLNREIGPDEDPALARLPARRHGLERLHAPARPRVERGRGTTSRCSRRSRTRSGSTSAGPPSCAPTSAGCCPSSCSTGTRATTVKRVPDCTRAELELGSRRTPRPCGSCSRPTSSSPTTSCSAGRSGAATRRALRGQGARLRARVRDAGQRRRSRRGGREALAGASATFVGSAHIREVLEEVCGHVDRVHEVPPGVDVDEWRARAARRRARGAPRRGAPRPAEPRQRGGAAPRRWQRRAARARSSPATGRPSSTSAS